MSIRIVGQRVDDDLVGEWVGACDNKRGSQTSFSAAEERITIRSPLNAFTTTCRSVLMTASPGVSAVDGGCPATDGASASPLPATAQGDNSAPATRSRAASGSELGAAPRATASMRRSAWWESRSR
jgi:hypothetical protein